MSTNLTSICSAFTFWICSPAASVVQSSLVKFLASLSNVDSVWHWTFDNTGSGGQATYSLTLPRFHFLAFMDSLPVCFSCYSSYMRPLKFHGNIVGKQLPNFATWVTGEL